MEPGDLVLGDADGLVVGAVAQVERALGRAEEIERDEARILDALRGGRSLFELSNYHAHARAVAEGTDSRLTLLPPD